MWAKLDRYKNNYLQMQLKHLKPKEINELVDGDLAKNQNLPGCYSKDICESDSYFEDRAEVAYGFWALPKLMKELNSDDSLTRWKATKSLSEYVMNPLHAQTAIKYRIVRRCQNLFLRILTQDDKKHIKQLKGLLVIFYFIAMHGNGVCRIVEKNRLLDAFYTIIAKREVYMDGVIKILPLLSAHKHTSLLLINDYDVMEQLWNIWSRDPFGFYHCSLWLHLTHIFELSPEKAVSKGFFELLFNRISKRIKHYHVWEMKCFGLLMRSVEGQKRFLELVGVKFLYDILCEEKLDNYENVVFTLMHALFNKSILWRCREFTNFPTILIELAKDSKKCQQQLFCLQAVRDMAVMPVIKRFIKENCLEDIRNLECEIPSAERKRNELIYWLEREIYHTSKLSLEILNPEQIE